MNLNAKILIIFMSIILCQRLLAQDRGTPQHYGFSAGPGFIYSEKPYRGMDAKINAFPFISYQVQNFYFRGPEIGYKVYGNDKISVNLIGNWHFGGYDNDDSRYLDGMDDRDMTLELGASFSYKDPFGETTISFLNDILGRHKGQSADLSYSKMFRIKKLSLTPSIAMQWHSENFTDYYYGVRRRESSPARPRYSPKDTFSPFASMQLIYRINNKWDIFSNFKYQLLGKEISDSPIIDQHHQSSFMLGLIYRF